MDLDGEWYLPDFYLPEFPMWVEVKGAAPSERERELCRRLRDKSKQMVLIAVGSPLAGSQQLIVFPTAGGELDRSQFLADRRNEGEYWFAHGEIDEPTNHWWPIGPVDGPSHDRLPIISPRLREAYQKATEARFEKGEA
jgi:hypothetical protein